MSDSESRRVRRPGALAGLLKPILGGLLKPILGALSGTSDDEESSGPAAAAALRTRLPRLEFRTGGRAVASPERSVQGPAFTARGEGSPLERGDVDAPIALSKEPSDEMLFADPGDDGASWYLPRYAIREDGNRLQAYLRSFDARAGGTLTLELERRPPEPIRAQIEEAGAQALEHEIEIVVRFSRPEGIQEEIAFASEETSETGDGRVTAVLTVTSAQRMSSLYQALSDPSLGARIVVQRTMRVALPVERAERESRERAAERQERRRRQGREQREAARREREQREAARQEREQREAARQERIAAVQRARASARRRDHRTERAGSPARARAGRVVRDHRRSRPVTRDADRQRPPARPSRSSTGSRQRERSVIAARRGRAAAPRERERTHVPPRRGRAAAPRERERTQVPARRGRAHEPDRQVRGRLDRDGDAVPTFRTTLVTLDQVLAPSTFSPDQQPHVFADAAERPATPGGVRRRTVRFGGREHDYYQDLSELNRFFYLPDEFRLARRDTSPYTPDLVVRFTREEETTVAELEYVGVPIVDHERLLDAAERLRDEHGHAFPDATGVELAPLRLNRQPALLLRVPGQGPEFREQPGVVVELNSGVRGGLRLPLASFERLFTSMLADGSAAGGEVRFEVGEGESAFRHHLPFRWSFRELAGEVFEFVLSSEDEGFTVEIVNAVESPVSIEHPEALGVRGDDVVEARLSGAELPVELRPEEAITVALEPGEDGTLEGLEAVVLPPGAYAVLPDDEAILGVIVDSAVGIDDVREIEVSVFRRSLEAPVPGVPGSRVLAVMVEFEDGSTEVFDVDGCEAVRCSARARVRTSLADAILRRSDAARYRYRITVHYSAEGEDGSLVDALESDLLEADGDVLILDLEHVRPAAS